jgi:CBS domain-containing protein
VAGADLIWAFRVMRLALLDVNSAAIGRVEDVVITAGTATEAPDVLGFVASSQRRRIFVNANRVAALESDGARLRSWDVDLSPFRLRSGELLVSRIIDSRVGDETVSDVALRPAAGMASTWEVAKVRLARRSPLRRRLSYRVVDWDEVPGLFAATDEAAAEAARLRDMHPSDVAHLVLNLPLPQRRKLAEAMEDDRLADVLEELSEAEQLKLIEDLDLDRLVSVLEEMEYDDAVDLLAEMPGEQRTRVLAAMDADDADVMRRLLSYGEGTAGGLMTPEVIVLGPTATVAEALAHMRDPDWQVSVAAQVFVTQPPFVPPTGTFLGLITFQRLLREPPSMELAAVVEPADTVTPDTSERDVAERLAAYNLLALPVCDERRRLLGGITVDDVLDRTLPAGWRQRRRAAVRSS